jgi:sugar phosphate isomerase/epimerase
VLIKYNTVDIYNTVDTRGPDDRLDLRRKIFDGRCLMICTYASLPQEKIKEIKELEEDLGKTLLAFSCKGVDIVPLNDEELKKIKALEEKLGISLVAVHK